MAALSNSGNLFDAGPQEKGGVQRKSNDFVRGGLPLELFSD